jgi:hypothetical protein
MEFFEYDNNSGMLQFNDYHILLIPEFGKLYSNEHNKCKEDKKGINKIKAKKEFAYMWLNFDRKSPYWQYSEHERHAESLADSGLTQEEFLDPDFQAACKKYQKILDSDRILKMIRAAMNKVDDITDYFNVIVDFNERDANGKPIYKVKDV